MLPELKIQKSPLQNGSLWQAKNNEALYALVLRIKASVAAKLGRADNLLKLNLIPAVRLGGLLRGCIL